MKTYLVRNIFESKMGMGVDIIPDDIAEDCATYYVGKGFISKWNISAGDTVDEELLSHIRYENDLRKAIYKAADILAGGDFSVSRLKKKLCEKGFDREIAEEASKYMEDRGYIREAEQAERAARFLLETKLRGRKRIAAELIQKGYGKVAVKSALSSISDEEFYEALCRHIKKKYRSPAEDRKEQEKRIAAMLRQGFDAGDIIKAMNEEDFCEGDF